MKAIVLKTFGGPENLIFAEFPLPEVKNDEVLIQVQAISINPVDVKTRAGKGMAGRLKEYQPIILGWDISGVITETGKDVTHFKKGDEVFGMVNFPGHGKAYAEYVAAPASQLALKPANITHEEAASATLAALTAWQAVVHHAKVKAGDRVLIHAASGGVGHYAVQIAKKLGAFVIGTSSAKNKDFVLSLGADEHLDYQSQSFEKVVRDVDFVLDTIGGENAERSLDILKPGALLISIPSGLSEGITKKAEAKGVRGLFILVASNGQDMKSLAELLRNGNLRSHVSSIYTLDQIANAHVQMETGRVVGKIAVTVD